MTQSSLIESEYMALSWGVRGKLEAVRRCSSGQDVAAEREGTYDRPLDLFPIGPTLDELVDTARRKVRE